MRNEIRTSFVAYVIRGPRVTTNRIDFREDVY